MRHFLISFFIIITPVLASQNAIASLLPCEKMAMNKEASLHAQHLEMIDISMDSEDLTADCSCDQNNCRISHTANGTLFDTEIAGIYFEPITIAPSIKPHLQIGIYTPPFRPPIQV